MKQSDIAAMVNHTVAPLGVDVSVLVGDYEQRGLHALPEPEKPPREPLPIDGSVAGRAFARIAIQQAAANQERLWVPVLDGTERLGVLEVSLPDRLSPDDPDVREACLALAGLVGHLLSSKTLHGDGIQALRQRIDCLANAWPQIESQHAWESLGLGPHGYGLVTLHRPSNVDQPAALRNVMSALERVCAELPLVFPVHPRTRNRLEQSGATAVTADDLADADVVCPHVTCPTAGDRATCRVTAAWTRCRPASR